MSSRQRRVVITGVGAISPLGNTKEALWEALASGRSGVGPLSAISPEATGVHAAAAARQFSGEIDDFGPLEKEQKKAIRKGLKVMCRECLMGTAPPSWPSKTPAKGWGSPIPSGPASASASITCSASRRSSPRAFSRASTSGGPSSFPAGARSDWPRCPPCGS